MQDIEMLCIKNMAYKANKQNCRLVDNDLSVKRQFCFIGGEIRK